MPVSAECDYTATIAPRGRRSANATTIVDILDAAKEEFASCGFDSAKVDSICRRAKVSKQLLYYYFGSKSDLYTLILKEAAEDTFEKFVGRTEYSALPPELALKEFIKNLFIDHIDRPQIVKMTIDEAQHGFAHVGKGSPLAMVLRKVIDEVLGEIIERGRSTGVFRADVDPDYLFWVIFSFVTTWFAHSPLVSLVSRAGGGSSMDAMTWCTNSIEFVLASISKKS